MKTRSVQIGGVTHQYLDLFREVGARLTSLPYVLRLLCANHLRHGGDIGAFLRQFDGKAGEPFEFVVRPDRLLMHDTTATPALTDIAAMRDVLRDRGADPRSLSPVLPVHVSVDHSLAVDAYARTDALRINLRNELERNRERYAFLKWASNALDNLTVFPPGTGIMHTINLEQLAAIMNRDRNGICHPEFMLGTDSHTPMVNGIGVLAWGIGGLEAESIMVGQPATLAVPEVVGVRMTGRLPRTTLSTDLALTVTHRLRELGVAGSFVEFFGPGVLNLRAEDRSVIANMAPEYGATTGYFPVDEHAISYLRSVGRDGALLGRIETIFRAQRLWFDPDDCPEYDRIVEIDLSEVGQTLAGPRRPQDKMSTAGAAASVEKAIGRKLVAANRAEVPDGAVGVAAITSCTNTSDPRMLVLAGLLAREARRRGLRPKAWVKTSLAPGSPASRDLLQRADLLDDLSAIGFDIVGIGCTTCIGNSGALPEAIEGALAENKAVVAVLSGNRNFPGRIHPKLNLAFLASPPLVIAYALMGTVGGDPLIDPIGTALDGNPVFLVDLWPTQQEVDDALSEARCPTSVATAFDRARASTDWLRIAAPSSANFPWTEGSRILTAPPFVDGDNPEWQSDYTAYPLLVLGDDITTDHISPAGWIDPASPAGRWLTQRGADPDDLNVFASYRGNWEVMLRGLFSNKTVVNLLDETLPPGTTRVPGRQTAMSLIAAAAHYKARGLPNVIVAGERYGSGSSRDWAAKGVALLGVRAIIARSFERIHRTNLIAMGIAPVTLGGTFDPSLFRSNPGTAIRIRFPDTCPGPRSEVSVELCGQSGPAGTLSGELAVLTQSEADQVRSGGIFAQIMGASPGGPGAVRTGWRD